MAILKLIQKIFVNIFTAMSIYWIYTPYYIWAIRGYHQWCSLLGSMGGFRSFNIILPSPSQSYQWRSVSDMSSHLVMLADILVLLILDKCIYRVSDWLLQTTSQMCCMVHLSGLWGHWHYGSYYSRAYCLSWEKWTELHHFSCGEGFQFSKCRQ